MAKDKDLKEKVAPASGGARTTEGASLSEQIKSVMTGGPETGGDPSKPAEPAAPAPAGTTGEEAPPIPSAQGGTPDTGVKPAPAGTVEAGGQGTLVHPETKPTPDPAQAKISEQGNKIAQLESELARIRSESSQVDDKAFKAKLLKEAGQKLAALKEDDPDLTTKQLEIMVDMADQLSERRAQIASTKAVTEGTERQRQEAARNTLIDAKLTEAGFDVEKNPRFRAQFYRTLDVLYAEDRTGFAALSPDEQWTKVLDDMRAMWELTGGKVQQIADANKEGKEKAKILGRGGQMPKSTDEQPMSMAQQLKQYNKDRVYSGPASGT